MGELIVFANASCCARGAYVSDKASSRVDRVGGHLAVAARAEWGIDHSGYERRRPAGILGQPYTDRRPRCGRNSHDWHKSDGAIWLICDNHSERRGNDHTWNRSNIHDWHRRDVCTSPHRDVYSHTDIYPNPTAGEIECQSNDDYRGWVY